MIVNDIVSPQEAHQARNAAAKTDAAERRDMRRFIGEAQARLHNARLQKIRLDAGGSNNGLAIYQRTHAQVSASEGTSDESQGGQIFYRVPMTLEAFIEALPAGTMVTREDGYHTFRQNGAVSAVLEIDRRKAIIIAVDYNIVASHDDPADIQEMLAVHSGYQDQLANFHLHVLAQGADTVQWEDA